MHACVLHCLTSLSNCLQPHGPQPARRLCPCDSPGKNTGVGCCVLLRGIFLTQELSPCLFCLLLWQAGSLLLAPPGKPFIDMSQWLTIRRFQVKMKHFPSYSENSRWATLDLHLNFFSIWSIFCFTYPFKCFCLAA